MAIRYRVTFTRTVTVEIEIDARRPDTNRYIANTEEVIATAAPQIRSTRKRYGPWQPQVVRFVQDVVGGGVTHWPIWYAHLDQGGRS
ncbi:MAG TPA: hypothetical protein VFY38_14615 [Pseudonocardia sp.]|nr:hypothetical protein [Pseudonocardia sp.]